MPSLTERVISVVPMRSAAGVIVSKRLLPEFDMTMASSGTSV